MDKQPKIPMRTPLMHIQSTFAILDLNGETRVVDRRKIDQLGSNEEFCGISYYKKFDAELHMRRELEVLPIASNPIQVIKDFWVNPSTHLYNQVAFSPLKTPPNVLNYWQGCTVDPHEGDWTCIQSYLHEIVCAADQSTYDYLIHYLAHMLQKPEEKSGVMIVLLGGQGTGKGVFFKLIRQIWRRSTLLISDIDQVLGRFNAALERNFIVCMDEALFAGDKKAMDRLKSLVTESTIHIEQKYQPARSIDSVHRFFAASNHEHFASIDHDDRRFLFLRVSSKHQRDTTYFGAVCNAIQDSKTISAMVHDLKKINLDKFNVRLKPETRELADQKIQSLRGFARFWFEVLTTGDLSGGKGTCIRWNKARFVPTKTLNYAYLHFDPKAEKYQCHQEIQSVRALMKLCSSAQRARSMVHEIGCTGKEQLRGLMLPDLAVARSEFSKYLGCSIDWEDATATYQLATNSVSHVVGVDSVF